LKKGVKSFEKRISPFFKAKNHLATHFFGVEEFLSTYEIWATISSLILPPDIIMIMKFDL
jgi:hypothetical protein